LWDFYIKERNVNLESGIWDIEYWDYRKGEGERWEKRQEKGEVKQALVGRVRCYGLWVK